MLPALIIGAGPSGLCTAYHLKRRGIPAVVIERGPSPGTSFARMRASMRLVSPRSFSALPGMPFPPGTPEYLPMPRFHEYLVDYAARHALDVRCGTEVTGVERVDGGAFRVRLAQGEPLTARALVACTGVYATPRVPPELGLERATVPWIHAADYREPGALAGARTLIVGNGISAQEIALELIASGPVTMSGRRPFRVVPNPVLGVDLHWFAWLPEMVPVRWARWAVRHAQEPLSGAAIRRALRRGDVRPRPGVARIDGGEVTFDDGARERFERLVLATGYRPTVSWLGELARVEDDGLGDVVDCASTRVPGLWFVGFPFVRTFASRYLRGIRRDAAYVAGRIAGPS